MSGDIRRISVTTRDYGKKERDWPWTGMSALGLRWTGLDITFYSEPASILPMNRGLAPKSSKSAGSNTQDAPRLSLCEDSLPKLPVLGAA